MAVSTDPRYQPLAAIAAGALGASGQSDVVRAILAQWQCEQSPNAWPPARNNPGNVTNGALASVGWVVHEGSGVPKKAQFATPEQGAQAYGYLLAQANRYRTAVARARAGDGAGFLKAVTDAGYGTRYSCAYAVYLGAGGTQAASSANVPGATTSVTPAGLLTSYDPNATETTTLPFRDVFLKNFAGGGFTASTRLTAGWLRQYVLFEIETTGTGTPDQTSSGQSIGDANAAAITAAGSKYIGTPGGQLPATITVALHPPSPGPLASAQYVLANLPSVVGGILQHAALLVAILVVLILGLWLVAAAESEPHGSGWLSLGSTGVGS